MAVLRIVANIQTLDPKQVSSFYEAVFGLGVVMDFDWIKTLQADDVKASVQLSAASQGGSGTAVPDLSIEVDDLDDVLNRIGTMGLTPDYGPVNEPWGVRRFYLRDPAGTLLNILSHIPKGAGD